MPDTTRQAALEHIRRHSAPDDYVLTWGLTAALNAVAPRREPSGYFHEFPLSTQGYVDAAMIQRFLGELEQHPPAVILDSSAESRRLPPMDAGARQRWLSESNGAWHDELATLLTPVFRYVQRHYEPLADSPSPWVVYRRAPRS